MKKKLIITLAAVVLVAAALTSAITIDKYNKQQDTELIKEVIMIEQKTVLDASVFDDYSVFNPAEFDDETKEVALADYKEELAYIYSSDKQIKTYEDAKSSVLYNDGECTDRIVSTGVFDVIINDISLDSDSAKVEAEVFTWTKKIYLVDDGTYNTVIPVNKATVKYTFTKTEDGWKIADSTIGQLEFDADKSYEKAFTNFSDAFDFLNESEASNTFAE